jgi:hypothetical protein
MAERRKGIELQGTPETSDSRLEIPSAFPALAKAPQAKIKISFAQLVSGPVVEGIDMTGPRQKYDPRPGVLHVPRFVSEGAIAKKNHGE